MKHYITSENKILGFDDTQADLVPPNAVLIPEIYTTEQIPFLTLLNGNIEFNQTAFDKNKNDAQNAANTKASALAKLTALGLTEDEIKALLG